MSLIDEIERIRAQNNHLWMALLSLAMEHAPYEAKKILRNINNNDRAIGDLLEKLSAPSD